MTREQRLAEIAKIAVRLEAATGVPSTLLVTQWALESHWGSTPAGKSNYFGVKKSSRHQKCCTVVTHEVINGKREEKSLEFADYDSLEDSCADYAWMISNAAPYHMAWSKYLADRDVTELIQAIAGVYASDPNYSHLACIISAQQNVAGAIAEARAV